MRAPEPDTEPEEFRKVLELMRERTAQEPLEAMLCRLSNPGSPYTKMMSVSEFERLANGARRGECAGRILDRWSAVVEVLEKAQRVMRAHSALSLLDAADEIDRVLKGIGGSP